MTTTGTTTSAESSAAGQGDGTQGAAGTPAAVSEILNVIGPDGTLKEGWGDVLVPEEFRKPDSTTKVYDGVSDLKGVFKMLGHQERLIRADKIVVPTEKSPPEVWEAYYRAGGRPDKPDGYVMEIPKGQEDYFNEALVAQAKTMFHDIGLNPKQAAALWEFEKKRLETGIAQMEAADAEEHKEAETALRTRWKTAYDERKHLANRMIEENVSDPEAKKALLDNYGNDPYFADFLATIGQKFMEHKIPPTAEAGALVEDEIKKLESTPGFMDGSLKAKNRAEHDRIMGELTRLYENKFPGERKAPVIP